MIRNTQPRTLRDRLQMAAFAMVVLVGALATTMHLGGPTTSPFGHLFGDDLVPSYMAGTFLREGRADLLHDYAAAEIFQRELRQANGLEQHGRTGPWLNPPYYAAIFVPLSALPYSAALWTWFTLNVLMLSASIVLLYRMLPAEKRRTLDAAIIAGLLIASMPALQALACQQNTFLSLLILCAAVTLARSEKPFAAGAVAALLLFKPQLAVIVCGALACTLGWRAIAGMTASAAMLLGATVVLLPGTLSDYLHKLPALLPYLRTDRPYPWERQTTFLGFWRLLLDGRTGGANPPAVTILWLVGAAAVAITLIPPLWRAFAGETGWVSLFTTKARRTRRSQLAGDEPDRSHHNPSSAGLLRVLRALRAFVVNTGTSGSPLTRDRLLAATIAASPLLMPYYMDYDLLLLAVPAVLLTAERMSTGRQPGDRWLIAGWIAVYLWMYVNAAFADATGVSVIVLLMLVRFYMPVRTVWEMGHGRPVPDSLALEERPIRNTGFRPVPATLKSADRVCLQASHRPHGLEARVTDVSFKLPVTLAAIAVGLALLAGVADRSSPLTFGHDLLPGYVAGRMAVDGRAADLYDVSATRQVGRAIIVSENLTKDPSHILWLNPPAFAWLFAPLALLPYRAALLVWLGLNVVVGTAALRAIVGWISQKGTRVPWAGVLACPWRRSVIDDPATGSGLPQPMAPDHIDTVDTIVRSRPLAAWTLLALVVSSCPFLLAVEHQQTTFLSLGILTAAVIAWRGDRPMIAGLLVGLLSLKPQLAFAVGLVLWIMEGRRALAGMAISAFGLAAAGEILSPGSTRDFLANVPAAAASLQIHPGYNWGRQMTPTAFFRTVLGVDAQIATIAGHGASAAILLVVGWKAWMLRRDTTAVPIDATTPGAMPPGRVGLDKVLHLRQEAINPAAIIAERSSNATRGHSPRREAFDRVRDLARVRSIVLAFLAMPLCAPYFMDYDLLLLAIPATLLVRECSTRALAMAGAALWVMLYVNVDLVALTRINGVVLLLTALVGLTLFWFRRDVQPIRVDDLLPRHPLSLQPARP